MLCVLCETCVDSDTWSVMQDRGTYGRLNQVPAVVDVDTGFGFGFGPLMTCHRTRSKVATESSIELCPAAPAL